MILRIRCFFDEGTAYILSNNQSHGSPKSRASAEFSKSHHVLFRIFVGFGSAVSFLRGVVTEQIKYNTTQIHTGNTFYQVDISKQFIVTFPAGWSPQQVVIVRELFPKWPKHSGEGFLINCPDYFHLYEFASGESPTYQ